MRISNSFQTTDPSQRKARQESICRCCVFAVHAGEHGGRNLCAAICCLWEALRHRGAEFRSVTEQFDTASPTGRAMLNIVMTFAQLERETTAERETLLHTAPRGAQPTGLDFASLSFEEKKLVAAEFIARIEQRGDHAHIVWRYSETAPPAPSTVLPVVPNAEILHACVYKFFKFVRKFNSLCAFSRSYGKMCKEKYEKKSAATRKYAMMYQ